MPIGWLISPRIRARLRACHYIATVAGLLGGVLLSVFVVWWGGLFALGGASYALALASHPLFQGNRPFARRPAWGLLCDFRMLGLARTGGLRAELARLPAAA
ncbi:MAG TPA: Mpo1-like protein [Burkholderiales bacterium]